MSRLRTSIACFAWAAVLISLGMVVGAGGLEAQEPSTGSGLSDFSHWFGVLELPFLVIAVWFGFRTARALKGGVFGYGIGLIAWGFLVMAIGHLHLQVDHFWSVNLFGALLGEAGGQIVWFVALMVTWGLTGTGFYSLYRVSRHG